MSYNGWKNKETWLVNLWLGDVFAMMQDEGENITADFIRDYVEESLEGCVIGSFTQDMINCALGEIDYREIASYYVTEEESEE